MLRSAYTWPSAVRVSLQVVFLGFLSLIAYFSLVDRFPYEIAIDGLRHDHAEHAAAFAVLTLLSLALWAPTGSVLVLLIGAAAILETMQIWLPDRQADWTDFLASGSGIAVGFLLLVAVRISWVISGWLPD